MIQQVFGVQASEADVESHRTAEREETHVDYLPVTNQFNLALIRAQTRR